MPSVDYTCNAVLKRGQKALICEKPLGHAEEPVPLHRDGDVTWTEEPW